MFRCLVKKVVPTTTNYYSFSYAFGPSNESLSPQTISEIFDENAKQCPERIACVSHHQGITKTYRQLTNDVSILIKQMLIIINLYNN